MKRVSIQVTKHMQAESTQLRSMVVLPQYKRGNKGSAATEEKIRASGFDTYVRYLPV